MTEEPVANKERPDPVSHPFDPSRTRTPFESASRISASWSRLCSRRCLTLETLRRAAWLRVRVPAKGRRHAYQSR
jgi:hypothetical protein